MIKSWGYRDLGNIISTDVVTASGDITLTPSILFFILCTHTGNAKAVVEIFDNGTGGTKKLHLESASGDVAPFGLSLTRPISFDDKITLAFTATGFNATIGYRASIL